MANYYEKTVSENGKVKLENRDAVEKIMAKYKFGNEGDLRVKLSEMNDSEHSLELEIYGDDQCVAYAIEDEDADEEIMENFLQEVAPYIEDDFIVRAAGSEGFRYMISYAYVVMKGQVHCVNIDTAISDLIRILEK